MNFYVDLISGVTDYIEENIHEPLQIEAVAQQFGFSEFHFNRIFSMVTGKTLKQYILGRKLTLAVDKLGTTSEAVIDIAFDHGFNSPEVFSRAFKKYFGISPNRYRQTRPGLNVTPKTVVVERDIISHQGQLTLRGQSIFLEGFDLFGAQVNINVNLPGFETKLQSASDAFYHAARHSDHFFLEAFYTLVNCMGEDDGRYCVFFGMKPRGSGGLTSYLIRSVPQGWYEKFLYVGDMFDIRASFINDLYRWIMINEIELEMNGIGMLNLYHADCPETHEVEIYVPIKKPK